MNSDQGFDWLDAEVFSAIAWGATDDTGVIGFVDWIQHMIMTDAELKSSLENLVQAGWIERNDNKLELSKKAKLAVKDAQGKNVQHTRKACARALGVERIS